VPKFLTLSAPETNDFSLLKTVFDGYNISKSIVDKGDMLEILTVLKSFTQQILFGRESITIPKANC